MKKFDLSGSTALITGASAGIGREFARQLAGRSGSLVLVARRSDRLRELQAELTARDPNLNVHVHAADLADPTAITKLCVWLDHEKIEIDLLINNAGLGDRGDFATSELQRISEMTRVNVEALTVLTRQLVPGMIHRRRGAILNVSSSASFLPIAGFAVYAASKAYVTSFSEALGMELSGSGVTVTALCPGPVETEFDAVAKRTSTAGDKAAPKFTYVPVEEVVRAGLAGVERGRPVVIPGLVMKLSMLILRFTPMPLLRLAARFTHA